MRTSLNVPESVLGEFDETWRAEGMDSRSRAVREAMQEYVESHARLEALTGDVATVLAYDYDHDAVVDSIYDVQHDFEDVITATNHVHHGDWCLETVFCHGPAPRVRELVFRLRDFDAVARVKVLLLRPDDA